jgi:hypothetical protein
VSRLNSAKATMTSLTNLARRNRGRGASIIRSVAISVAKGAP